MAAAFVPARRRGALAVAGLAQAKHSDPVDSDAALEAQVNDVRDAPGLSAPGRHGLGVPSRAWIAVGAAALLWGIVAAIAVFAF